MSEEFEVRGVHEDQMDEAAEQDPRGMAGRLAVTAAILAMAGATQAEAGLLKNDAAIKKTEAANQWSYYQAKGNKQNLSELGMELSTDSRKPFFAAEVKRYGAEKTQIKLAADKLEKASAEFDEKSEAQIHRHHRWAQATMLLQIGIAMAAIALLTRKQWLGKLVLAMGTLGVLIGALAYFGI
jgi:hypothetical protein